MACVSVLIGQCGNQLGATIYNTVASEAVNSRDESYQSSVSRSFFREPQQGSSLGALPARGAGGAVLPETRSILVDMEPKVINDSIAKAKALGLFSVSPKQCVAKEEGSANNWAFGYSQQGPSRREAIAENLRKEAEEGGAVGSFQILHSLAGGTGSGVGTLTSEIVRDEFPRSIIMHTAVLPFSHGEVITQWYNLIFTLSYINETADSITLLANDDYARMIKQNAFSVPSAASMNTGSKSSTAAASSSLRHNQQQQPVPTTARDDAPATSLHDINELMGDAIASLWLPSRLLPTPQRVVRHTKIGGGGGSSSSVSSSGSLGSIRPAAITDIVEFVACDPRQKFLQASCFPNYGRGMAARYKNSTWPSVVGAAMRERALHQSDRFLLSLRGADAFGSGSGSNKATHPRSGGGGGGLTAHNGAAEVGHLLAAGQDDQRLPPAPDALHGSNVPFRGEEAFVSLFDTSRTIGHRIAYAAHRAERMFGVNAFTHHFHRFGVEDDLFQNVLANSWHLAKGYGDNGEGLDDDEDSGDDDDPDMGGDV